MHSPEQPSIAPYEVDYYDAVIKALYQDVSWQHRGMADRVKYLSGYFLGKPYLSGALGEGPQGRFDQSPLYRTEAFDCVTFVNTVLALALADSLPHFQQQLLKINYYHGTPLYQNRYHFIEVDWNIQNAQQGWVRDVTANIADTVGGCLTAVAHIDRPRWFRHRTLADVKLLTPISSQAAQNLLIELQLLASQMHCEENHLMYLPLSQLFLKGQPDHRIFNQIPHGAIIEIVRPSWDLRTSIGTHLNISHMGWAVQVGKELIFREASSLERRVREVPLVGYLQHFLDSPTIKGIHVREIIAGDVTG